MSVRATLGLRTQTRLALTPRMRESLAILRMPAVDLMELAQREAEENPFLRLRGGGLSAAGEDATLRIAAGERGMVEDLVHQIRQRPLPDAVRAAAEMLAGLLREDGYLDDDLSAIAAETGRPEVQLAQGLTVLQSCEPAGVGARNLAECIQLQLVDRGLSPEMALHTVAALADLAAGRFAAAARQMAVPLAEVERIAGLLRGIDPHPVKPEAAPVVPLRPDLSVKLAPDGQLAVTIAAGVPVLSLDAALATSAFATPRRLRAEALIAAVQARHDTLLAIGRAVVARQEAFFRDGPDGLRPLTRADLAGELGIHPSTLGRAVAGKGLEAGGRILPLALFFSSAIATEGEGLSSFVLSRRIARMIAEEAEGAPLTDTEIAARLAEEGVDIARRTVAKYREGMRIPSSRRRRRDGVRRAGEG